MDEENLFYTQLAKTIQAWLWIETELYLLYSMLMGGANPHLVSVTFNSIQSIEAKLTLLNSCFHLVLPKDSKEDKEWNILRKKVSNLNAKRNKIVHEPVSVAVTKGKKTVSLGPSVLNALALVKGQTSNKINPVLSNEYDPRKAKLLVDHRLDLRGVVMLEKSFKQTACDLRDFREKSVRIVGLALKTKK